MIDPRIEVTGRRPPVYDDYASAPEIISCAYGADVMPAHTACGWGVDCGSNLLQTHSCKRDRRPTTAKSLAPVSWVDSAWLTGVGLSFLCYRNFGSRSTPG